MKNSLKICFLFFTLFLFSCEKISLEKDVIETLTIDSDSHSFINKDGYPYYDNNLTSQQDKHVYKLEMNKDVEYRISASQPNAKVHQIILNLVNKSKDTLAISSDESPSKSFIVIKSPETATYYLIVSLRKMINPKFDYRLNFEELVENEVSLSGLNWLCDGTWNINNSGEAVLTNYDSRIYRHLKLNSPVSENPDVSFIIKSNSTSSPNVGIIAGGSGGLIQFGEYTSEFPGKGQAFLAFIDDMNYTLINLNTTSMSLDWGYLSGIFDYYSGIELELKYDTNSNQYRIYLNNTYVTSLHSIIQLKDFYICIQENGEGTTLIKDLVITN